MLAAQVKAGKLPSLQKRLPENPYVLPHSWVKKGNYGGVLKINITSTSNDAGIGEWFYGSSLLRFLNDGQTVGPGVVESWTSNADTSEWTFRLRAGLRWSDGHPVTTDDILFWWQDMATYDAYTPEGVPDECRSAKGTACSLTAKDAHTFVMRFDAPAPLTADRLALWTNGYGGNGPSWIVPSHFVKQFHPKYNKKVPKNWVAPGGEWERKASYRRNPKCPTLIGYQLVRYDDGRSLTWERNPYYYGVTAAGDQLPYIDRIVMTQVQDPQVGKLQIGSGKVDMVYAPFNSVTLADVSTFNRSADSAGIKILMWDSGDGTGSMFFVNQDYYDPKYRDLFAKPKFRQALSHGFNRAQARTAIYFNTGDPTTGTMSPKAAEFHVNDTGEKTYVHWRDAYVKFDVAKAKRLLDGLGLVDTDGDGYREFPDGSKLTLRIDLQADATDEHRQKDNQLVRDWKDIGIKTVVNPVPPTSFADNWASGKYMCHSNWSLGDGPNCLVYPQWLVPMENTRWAPLQGQMYASIGTKAYRSEKDVDPWKRKPPRRMPEPGGSVAKLWKLYEATKSEQDEMKRTRLVWEMIKVHIASGPFFQGTVANPPWPIIIKDGLMNVPTREQMFMNGFAGPWTHPAPAVYDPESYFWDKPDEHGL